MRGLKKALSLFLSVLMICGGIGLAGLQAFAASPTSFDLKTLADEGKIKLLGRTVVASDGLATDFSGTGFDINVNAASAGNFTLTYYSSYARRYAIGVDGDFTVFAGSTGTKTISVSLPAGNHTVRVIVDSELTSTKTYSTTMKSISFDGAVLARPADKDLYIEFIGDSYTCGDGGNGTYTPGTAWKSTEHSVRAGWAYKTAEKLDADYSIVARGGIGLGVGKSDAQDQDSSVTIQQLYPYTSYRFSVDAAAAEWDFASERKPDMILICIGANDSVSSTTNVTNWGERAELFLKEIREKRGADVPIVWMTANSVSSSKGAQYWAIRKLFDEKVNASAPLKDDTNLYAFRVNQMMNGSSATNAQCAGHPSDFDADGWADQVVDYTRKNVLPVKEAVLTDVATYYVSESGDDSADGLTEATAKKTLSSVLSAAYTAVGKKTEPAGSAVHIYVSGTVSCGVKQQFASASTLFTSDGKKMPVIIETLGYSESGVKAVLSGGADSAKDKGSSVMCFSNDYDFRNLEFHTIEGAATGWAAYRLFANVCTVTFDNVSFSTDGSHPFELYAGASRWYDSLLGKDVASPLPGESKLILKNGHYDTTNNVALVTTASGGIYNSTDKVTYKSFLDLDVCLVIGEGAVIQDNYTAATSGLNGGYTYKSLTTEIARGGLLEGNYYGSDNSGTAYTYNADIVCRVTGGTIYGMYYGLGENATLNGNLRFEMTSGELITKPGTASYQGFFIGGYNDCTINGNIENTVSGGQLTPQGVADKTCAAWFGGRNGMNVSGNVINTISGGAFALYTKAASASGFYFGPLGGVIHGDLVNTISGGTFDTVPAGVGGIWLGDQSVSYALGGKQVNTIGVQGAERNRGPIFCLPSGKQVKCTGWGRIGADAIVKEYPAEISDVLRVKNTVYGGVFQCEVVLAPDQVKSDTNISNGYYSFTHGNVETVIENGMFQNTLYCGGGNVWGDVTTTIRGGIFKSIYAATGSVSDSVIHGNATLNIENMRDYVLPANNSSAGSGDKFVIYAGAKNGTVEGDLNLNITGGDIHQKIFAASEKGEILGKTNVSVSGATLNAAFSAGKAETVTWGKDIKIGATPLAELGICGQTVVLDSTFGVRVLLPVASYNKLVAVFGAENLSASYTLANGETFAAQWEDITVDGTAYKSFLLKGIAPKDAGKTVALSACICGGAYDTFNDSVAFALQQVLSAGEDVYDREFLDAAQAILEFCDAAAEYLEAEDPAILPGGEKLSFVGTAAFEGQFIADHGKDETKPLAISGTNLILDDEISIQFWIRATASQMEGARLFLNGKEVTGFEAEQRGRYFVVKTPCDVRHMGEPITVQLKNAAGDVISNTYSDSVVSYCLTAIEQERTYAALAPLAEKLLNYIYYANLMLEANA